MADINVFALAQIIKAAGSDPSDITDAVWAAGYRKPERSTEEAVTLTLEIISGCHGADIEWSVWPKNYDEILQCELNEFVEEALHVYKTAHSIASVLIAAEYSKEVTSD